MNINFSYTDVGQKALHWEVRTFYEVWILQTKRRFSGKMLAGEMFCMVCLYCFFLKCDTRWTNTSG